MLNFLKYYGSDRDVINSMCEAFDEWGGGFDDVFRDPTSDPRNEFLTRDDFSAGPPAPGGPSRRMPELLADQRRFTVSRLWTDIPEAD